MILVIITGVYVVVTYLLVKEQRLQGQHPSIVFRLIGGEAQNADLRLCNVGTGTAAELTILAGPGDEVVRASPPFGSRTNLLPEDVFVWKIRPLDEARGFGSGAFLPTISYFDNHRSKIFLEVVLLEFEESDGRRWVRNRGSIETSSGKRSLRRHARRSLPLHRRLGFQWRTRDRELPSLMLDDDIRNELRRVLAEKADELKRLGPRMEKLRTKV